MKLSRIPTVVIAGRPNAGKSTLFNMLSKRKAALIDAVAGTTRDILENMINIDGCLVRLLDTGGLYAAGTLSIDKEAHDMAAESLNNADIVLFCVDTGSDFTALDDEIARLLHKSSAKKVLCVGTRTDMAGTKNRCDMLESFGFGQPVCVSVRSKTGIVLLRQSIAEIAGNIPSSSHEPNDVLDVAVVGRPNTGKSTFINAVLGRNRLITREEPGTTRDVVATTLRYKGRLVRLIDTAGIRKTGKAERLERAGVRQAVASASRSDMVIQVLDASSGVVTWDVRIAGKVADSGRRSVFLLNKWDLLDPDEKNIDAWRNEVHRKMPFARNAPVLSVSAIDGRNVRRAFHLALDAAAVEPVLVDTRRLNRWIREIQDERAHPARGGKRPVFVYLKQDAHDKGCFIMMAKGRGKIRADYLRFLAGRLTKDFKLGNRPVRWKIRMEDRKK